MDFSDNVQMYKLATEYGKITEPDVQTYALRYVMGLLQRERSKKADPRRRMMLKQLASTIAGLPIPMAYQEEQ